MALAIIVLCLLWLVSAIIGAIGDGAPETSNAPALEPAPEPAPEPPPSKIASPGFYPASYDIEATYTEDPHAISGTQRVRYVNAENKPMKSLHFQMWTNERVFTDLGGGTEVSKVRVDGEKAKFSARGTDLEVKLPSPLAENETARVSLDFETTIPEIAAPFGHQPGASSLGVWHPVLAVHDQSGWNLDPPTQFGEPYFAEPADYQVNLTLPRDLTPIGTGAEKSRSEDEDEKTVTFDAKSVRDFALSVGEDYSRKSREVMGTRINIYYHPDSEMRAERALDLASKSFERFSNLYGAYPYRELDLVDTPLAAGTEFSSFAFISMANTEDYLFDTVIPHEVAHQWWYVQVGNKQFDEPWLDESLATYSEWVFAGDADTRFPQTTEPSVPLDSPVNDFPDKSTYQSVTYLYGAQLYRDLAQEIGEDTLMRGLHDYVSRYRYKTATSEDLIQTLSNAAGKDLTPYFEAHGVTAQSRQNNR